MTSVLQSTIHIDTIVVSPLLVAIIPFDLSKEIHERICQQPARSMEQPSDSTYKFI